MWPGRGGTCIPVKLCFQAVWLGLPGSRRCNAATMVAVGQGRYFWHALSVVLAHVDTSPQWQSTARACRRLPDRLASVLNLARSQTLQAGMAGRACCLGNLRTLATAYQANFSTHLVPVLVSGSTRHLELPAITLTRWEFPET